MTSAPTPVEKTTTIMNAGLETATNRARAAGLAGEIPLQASACMNATQCYACDSCKRIFSHDFELAEHERTTGHRGILTWP